MPLGQLGMFSELGAPILVERLLNRLISYAKAYISLKIMDFYAKRFTDF